MFGVPFLQAGSSCFLLIVESAPSGLVWTSGLSRYPVWGKLFLCSGGCSWISSLWNAVKSPVMSLGVSIGLAWLWADSLFVFRSVFLFCWEISMVRLALSLVGSWVVLCCSVGLETFGRALVY